MDDLIPGTLRSFLDPFVAKITAVTNTNGTFEYTFIEQTVHNETGDYVESVPGRTGQNAREMNNRNISSPGNTPVRMWYRGTTLGDLIPTFDGSGLFSSSSSITVKESDGSPSNTASTVEFDQSDGFVVSFPSNNTAKIDLAPANTTQAGGVNTGVQAWDGEKTFHDGVVIRDDANTVSKFLTLRAVDNSGTFVNSTAYFSLINNLTLLGNTDVFNTYYSVWVGDSANPQIFLDSNGRRIFFNDNTVGVGNSPPQIWFRWNGGANTLQGKTFASGGLDFTSGLLTNTTLATGDLLYASNTNTLARRAIGTNTHVFTVVSGLPQWVDRWVSPPSASSDEAVAGQMAYLSDTTSYLYIAVATNTWGRVALNTSW